MLNPTNGMPYPIGYVSLKEFNHNRVVFYGRNDWAAGHFRDRVITLLVNSYTLDVESINDAIEAHQCKMTVEALPELFEAEGLVSIQESSRLFFSHACRFINRAIEQVDVGELYEEVGAQYCRCFWSFLAKSGASKRLEEESIEAFLNAHPECIGDILELKSVVDEHGLAIRDALLGNPLPVAELIIRRLATPASSKSSMVLPSALTNDDIDSIMSAYLNGDRPNPNYVKVLASWPSSKVDRYRPSPDTVVLARRIEKRSLEELFAEGTGIRYGVGVIISEQQVACKGITVDGFISRILSAAHGSNQA